MSFSRRVGSCALLLTAQLLPAQSLESTKNVKILASVQATGTGVLVFQYTVTNPTSSSAAVTMLSVDLTQAPGTQILATDDLPSGNGFESDIAAVIAQNKNSVPLVGVTVSAPAGWIATFAVDGRLLWSPTNSFFSPGQTIGGFEIYTHGLPGIRQFTAQPYIDVNNLSGLIPPNGDPGDLQRYKSDLRAAESGYITAGLTIAPVAPPIKLDPAAFLTMIMGYLNQATTQGWVTQAALLQSLQSKLAAAAQDLQNGNTNPAKGVLGAFINEVDAQSGKALTNEAAALLKINVQYLITNLY